MSKKQGLYLGKAGHLAVMSDFLLLGWNVAIHEVDVGDDVYVVEDGKGSLKQVQVKTVSAQHHKDDRGYSAKFTIGSNQLLAPASDLYYAFIIRSKESWFGPIIISRVDLLGQFAALNAKPQGGKSVNITVTIRSGAVKFRGADWLTHVRNFDAFPKIVH